MNRFEDFGVSAATGHRAAVLVQACDRALVRPLSQLRRVGAKGGDLAVPHRGDVQNLVIFLNRGPDFIGAQTNRAVECLKTDLEDGASGFVVRMPFLGMRQIDEVGVESFEDWAELIGGSVDVFSQGAIRQAEEKRFLRRQNVRGGRCFCFADSPRFFFREMRKAQFAGREEYDDGEIALLRVKTERPAAAEDFIIRMRRNAENVHPTII